MLLVLLGLDVDWLVFVALLVVSVDLFCLGLFGSLFLFAVVVMLVFGALVLVCLTLVVDVFIVSVELIWGVRFFLV